MSSGAADDTSAVSSLGEPMVHPAEIHGLALSADGRWAATGAADHFLRLWNATTGKLHGQPLRTKAPFIRWHLVLTAAW